MGATWLQTVKDERNFINICYVLYILHILKDDSVCRPDIVYNSDIRYILHNINPADIIKDTLHKRQIYQTATTCSVW